MKNFNIVFLPALMCTKKLYQHQIDTLKIIKNISVNIHTFTITDLPDITQAAEFIIRELNKLASKCYLVGTSLGGYIAMEIIKQNPNIIEKACLINTTWEADTESKIQSRNNIITDLEDMKDENFIPINDNIIESYLHNISVEKTNILKEMGKEIGRKGFINQQKLALSRSDYKSTLINSKIPCLIIGSEFDNITPSTIHIEMAKSIPLSVLHIIDNCSHLSPIDAPEQISNILVEWLIKEV